MSARGARKKVSRIRSNESDVQTPLNRPDSANTHMTAFANHALEAYDHLTVALVRARKAADERGLDPDECVTFMTTEMMHLIDTAHADYTVCHGFHGHAVRLIEGPGCVAFSAHPKMV